MVNLISIVQFDKGMAYYQIQTNKEENYSARLIRASENHRLPANIEIDKDLELKKEKSIADGITNKLICAIKTFSSLENNISYNCLS